MQSFDKFDTISSGNYAKFDRNPANREMKLTVLNMDVGIPVRENA